jgi:hypothetical protein
LGLVPFIADITPANVAAHLEQNKLL